MASATALFSEVSAILSGAQQVLSSVASANGTAVASGASKTTIVLSDIVTGAEAVAVADPIVSSVVVGGVELISEVASLIGALKSIKL